MHAIYTIIELLYSYTCMYVMIFLSSPKNEVVWYIFEIFKYLLPMATGW